MAKARTKKRRIKKRRPAKENEIKDWRQFEIMVSNLEQILRPPGCFFKSPDYLLDVEINGRREVDCSITFEVAGTTKVVSIECRKRGEKQDVTWIEQLATKMRALQLSGTIAVSSEGFSKKARLKAQRHGITLKTYREMQIPLELRPLHVSWHRRSSSLLNLQYEVSDECPEVTEDLRTALEAMLSVAKPDTLLLRFIGHDEYITIGQLIEHALNSGRSRRSTPSTQRTFRANLLKPMTFVGFPDSIPLTSVTIHVDVRTAEIPLSEPVFGDYEGVDGSLLRVVTVSPISAGSSNARSGLSVFFNTIESDD